jgi:hypothetical protein
MVTLPMARAAAALRPVPPPVTGPVGTPREIAGIDPVWLLLIPAIVIGTTIRLYPAFTSGGFPTGDGGLFLTMVRDLQAHHFALPAYTSYNHARIPFAYPPLGFYVAGLLQALTHLSIAQVFAIVPPLVMVFSLPAFALLARSLLTSNVAAVAAVFVFALLPDAYYPERMGGGITRSFGLLFALLTLHQLVLLYRRPTTARVALATLFATLTALSHPEWTLFVAYSAVILLCAMGRNRRGLISAAVVFGGALCLSAPWWLAVVTRHGFSPFLATLANSSSNSPWYGPPAALRGLHWTDGLGFPLTTALALLGLLACIASRRWLLPIWLVASFTVEARAYVERPVIVLALLAGVGIQGVLLPLLTRSGVPVGLREGNARGKQELAATNTGRPIDERPAWKGRVLPASVLGFLLFYLLGTTVAWDAGTTTQLSPADRQAMSWVQSHTPDSSRFFVVSVSKWGYTNPAEWFPALAERTNATNVLGYEWIPHAIALRDPAWNRALTCSSERAPCIDRWLRAHDRGVNYIYIPSDPVAPGKVGTAGNVCCRSLRASLDRFPGYVRVYDRRGVEIYHRGT